jgi:hypothetical protein
MKYAFLKKIPNIQWCQKMKNIIKHIEKCTTWRDLYSLKEAFLEHGLCIANTINGNRAICIIKDGRLVADNIFDDYIFIEGRDNDCIPEQIIDMVIEFVQDKCSKEVLRPHIKNYHVNASFYGKPLRIMNEREMMSEQQIKYISTLIQE